jgi:hypothetical protein
MIRYFFVGKNVFVIGFAAATPDCRKIEQDELAFALCHLHGPVVGVFIR